MGIWVPAALLTFPLAAGNRLTCGHRHAARNGARAERNRPHCPHLFGLSRLIRFPLRWRDGHFNHGGVFLQHHRTRSPGCDWLSAERKLRGNFFCSSRNSVWTSVLLRSTSKPIGSIKGAVQHFGEGPVFQCRCWCRKTRSWEQESNKTETDFVQDWLINDFRLRLSGVSLSVSQFHKTAEAAGTQGKWFNSRPGFMMKMPLSKTLLPLDVIKPKQVELGWFSVVWYKNYSKKNLKL